ncbi:MAG: hypothetical protein JW936_00880 [Sedimentisphaerales bacterium]|nr:hypothetical protein [Sedimentisphaerales bacterium]
MPKTQLIRLGHSPDSDDAFMFYALAHDLIETSPFKFEHILRDIQTLNDWAQESRLEVTAVSVHAYAYLHHQYAILTSGASMGATELATYQPDPDQIYALPDIPAPATGAHGPLLVARQPIPLTDLPQLNIAIPGKLTSAYLALQLAIGKFHETVLDFDAVLPAVLDGAVDAGLIIHEGQLTYQQQNLHCILDLGKWWYEQNQLPLPLGCNIIRRDLGPGAMQQISNILQQSILYSLTHRKEAIQYALQFGRGLPTATADNFIAMYVNQWTINYGPKGRQALTQFLNQAHKKNLTPPIPPLTFV